MLHGDRARLGPKAGSGRVGLTTALAVVSAVLGSLDAAGEWPHGRSPRSRITLATAPVPSRGYEFANRVTAAERRSALFRIPPRRVVAGQRPRKLRWPIALTRRALRGSPARFLASPLSPL